ncbi:8988_t:CDS:2 [Funneliformis geosporum]|uniref:8988_t:CDS:1 n=1 Tax=Funneliformis geosporum TaxID=1117311 RepID=A0A9W4SZI3_9GLOM|nr:8988_t:CDS:2 [Funneliformis geosporum]
MDKKQYQEILRKGDRNIVHEEFKVKDANQLYQICDNVYCLLAPSIPDDGVSRSGYCGLNELRMCGNYRQGNNWQRTDKSDNKKFCSEECFNNHYAEKCDKCQQKVLGQTYYNDIANKAGILCSSCHQKREEEERKETEILLQGIKKKILDAYNTLQKEAEQELSVSFFEIFDLSLVMKSKSYQANKDMEVNCKFFLCEQLKEKELASELETYVEQIKKEIKKIRETKLVSDKGDKNIPKQFNSSSLDNKIMNLEQNPNPNSQELDSKKQQLKALKTKSKELIKPLPLDTQITILQKEIKALTSKSTKTKAEESILASKKQELEELLKKQKKPNATETNPSNRTALYIGNKKLEGSLKLERFTNLRELVCSHNQLSRLEVSNCPNLKVIKCIDNQITELVIKNCPRVKELRCANNFLTDLDLSQNPELEILNIGSNNFLEQDLSFLGHLTNLKTLMLGNSDQERIEKGIYNRFIGSLDNLKNMNELDELGIANTDIDSGLEYLSNKVENFYCLADKRQDAKVQVIADLFANEQGVVEADKDYVLLAIQILKDRSQLLKLERKVEELQNQMNRLLNEQEQQQTKAQMEIPPKS